MVITNYDKTKHYFMKKRNSVMQETYLAGRKEKTMKKELMKEIEKLLEQASEKQVRMLARLIRAFFRV